MSSPRPTKITQDKESRSKIINAYMRNVENASGKNNNCAFNAFILGVSQAKILESIENNFADQPLPIDETLKDFIRPIAKALKLSTATWSAVKAALINLRASNPLELQEKIGPVLRSLSARLIQNKNSGGDYQLQLQPSLVSEFTDSLNTNTSTIAVRGDVFAYSATIKNKFKEIGKSPWINLMETILGNNPGGMTAEFYDQSFKKFIKDDSFDKDVRQSIEQTNKFFKKLIDDLMAHPENKNSNEINLQIQKLEADLNHQWRVMNLLKWWDSEGSQSYLNDMANPSLALYSGDIELAPLANLIGVNLWVRTIGNISEIHAHNGQFPVETLSLDEQQAMLSRNILRDHNRLLKKTPDEVKKLLGAIPEYDAVIAYVKSHPIVKGTPVPVSWSPDTIQQLKARDLVRLSDEGYQFDTTVNPDVVDERIKAMPRAKEIFQSWEVSYNEAPDVLLQNLKAQHWNHVPDVTFDLPVISQENFQDSEIVKMANEALGNIVDTLEANSATLANKPIVNNIFQNAFTLFADGVQKYSEKENGKEFFAKKSQELLKEIEQAVVINGGQFKSK